MIMPIPDDITVAIIGAGAVVNGVGWLQLIDISNRL